MHFTQNWFDEPTTSPGVLILLQGWCFDWRALVFDIGSLTSWQMATSDYDSDRDPRWQFRCALLQCCICGSGGHTYHHISNSEHAFCYWSNLVFGNGLHCQGTSKCIFSTFPIFCLPLFSFCEQRSKLGMWACARLCIFNSPDGLIWLIALLSTLLVQMLFHFLQFT